MNKVKALLIAHRDKEFVIYLIIVLKSKQMHYYIFECMCLKQSTFKEKLLNKNIMLFKFFSNLIKAYIFPSVFTRRISF